MNEANTNRHDPLGVRRSGQSGVRRRAITDDELNAYALAMLGFPNVDIEIDPLQLQIARQTTLDKYNEIAPTLKEGVIPNVIPGQTQYNLETIGIPFGRGVTDVRFVRRDAVFTPAYGVWALGIPAPINAMSPDLVTLTRTYLNTARRAYDVAPDWQWEEPVLWIFSSRMVGPMLVIAYEYAAEAQSVSEIHATHIPWVKDYFLALVKLMVGEARAKMPQIPGPQGTQMNGSDLKSEARESLAALEEDLRSRTRNLIPPIGPGR